MSTSTLVTGRLVAGRWTKVLWGWGFYTLNYQASTEAGGGEYRCYTSPSPVAIGSGALPNRIAHTVVGYGDVWLLSSVDTSYRLYPVSREALTGWPVN